MRHQPIHCYVPAGNKLFSQNSSSISQVHVIKQPTGQLTEPLNRTWLGLETVEIFFPRKTGQMALQQSEESCSGRVWTRPLGSESTKHPEGLNKVALNVYERWCHDCSTFYQTFLGNAECMHMQKQKSLGQVLSLKSTGTKWRWSDGPMTSSSARNDAH